MKKNKILLLLILVPFIYWGGKMAIASKASIANEKEVLISGNVTHGGQSYSWKRMKDGKKWMTENLNYEMADSWCYNDEAANCDGNGRLYSWEAAKKACPTDWRLPKDEEWRNMLKKYGGSDMDASDGGMAAYETLIIGGKSGFSALLSGYRSKNFLGIGSYCLYWSSLERNSSNGWCYYFDNNVKRLTRNNFSQRWAFYCRCLQD